MDEVVNKQLFSAGSEVELNLKKERARLEMMLDVTRLLSSNSDLSRVFPRISARIRRLLRQEFASLALHDRETGELIDHALDFPFGRGFLTQGSANSQETPAGIAIKKGEPLLLTHAELKELKGEVAKKLSAEGLQSLCCVPMLRPTGPMGVFVLGSTRPYAFGSEDLGLMNQVAAQLAVAIENGRAAAEIAELKARLQKEHLPLDRSSRPEGPFADIVGESAVLQHALAQAATVAPSEATVLILGETGTGKELVARAIHSMSRRYGAPFIKLNCAAIPTGLLESELFGHEKGAFTGAISRKIGRMELANGGTLFLDEVGEIPLELQPKLLRVLQDHEFERLGSNHTIRVDLRLVAATNRDLPLSIARHQFRSDLFYRLSVFPIELPPLRKRREDIPQLVRHFVGLFEQELGRKIETVPYETLNALMEWHWPGNVRELENLIERSVILSEGNVLRVPLWELNNPLRSDRSQDHSLDSAEREHIIRILRETDGVISGPHGAARRLGLKRTTLQSKMLKLRISRSDYEPR